MPKTHSGFLLDVKDAYDRDFGPAGDEKNVEMRRSDLFTSEAAVSAKKGQDGPGKVPDDVMDLIEGLNARRPEPDANLYRGVMMGVAGRVVARRG